MLWRHECSRYASSSRIGYHPNHPSASHPSSRPSSAATILRPFSAGRVPQQSSKQHQQNQHQHHQRASSALPRRRSPLQEGGRDSGASWDEHNADGESGLAAPRASRRGLRGSSRDRPRSAIPRLEAAAGGGTDDADELLAAASQHPERSFSASAARSDAGGADRGSDGVVAAGGRRSRSTSARSRSPMNRRANLAHQGEGEEEEQEGDEFLEEIYEDLDDEDDGELDNRISIMESRFSTAGRERPSSAVGDGANGGSSDQVDGGTHQRQRRSNPQRATAVSAITPRSATSQRPPRAPLQQQRQLSAGSQTTRRQLASSARTAGMETEDDDRHHGTRPPPHPSHPSAAIHDNNTRPPRVIRSRPTSAPVDRSVLDQDQRGGGGSRPHGPSTCPVEKVADVSWRQERRRRKSSGG